MDVYKIGVKLAMTSNHSQVISALSSSLLGVNAKVSQLTGGFSRLKLAIGGAFGVFAGEKMIAGAATLSRRQRPFA